MKNKQQQTKQPAGSRMALKNGISFQAGIDMNVGSQVVSFFPVIQVLMAVISSLSVVYMLPAFLHSKNGSFSGNFYISNGTTVFMVALLTSIAALLSTRKVKFIKFVGFSYLMLNALYILRHINSAVDGFMYTANVYSKCASLAEPMFPQTAAGVSTGDIEVFLLAFTFVITILTCFACIYHISFPIEFLSTFPIFELMTFWGMKFDEDYTWTLLGMLFCWVMILSLSLINHTARSKNQQCTFAVQNRKKTYYMTSEKIKSSFFGLMTYSIIVISLSVFAVTVAYVHIAGDVRSKKINKLRYDISNGVKQFSRDLSDQAEMINKPIPGRATKVVGGTNGGRLGLYDELQFSGKNTMKVYTPKFSRPMYLRGYAGESYMDNTWMPIRNDSKTAIDFNSQYGGYVIDYNFIHTYYTTVPGTPHYSVIIDPINCCEDLIYAPYGAYYSQIETADKQRYDGMLSPVTEEEGKNYEILMLPIAEEEATWDEIIAEKENFEPLGDEQDTLREYDERVIHAEDSIFLRVPEKTASSVDTIIEATGLTSDMTITEMENTVKEYFRSNGYTYDLSPGITPEGEDFISYFLDKQKKGYCTYYASAGVMIMRRLGVPARYVEGYVVEPSQYSSEKDAITVTDRSAHAWCEVFIDGCGWYPLEFTPGYQRDNPNLTNEDKNIKKPPKYKQESRPDAASKPDNSSKTVSKPSTSSNTQSKAQQTSSSDSSSKAKGAAGTTSSGTGTGEKGGKKPSDRTPEDAGGSKIDISQMMYILLTLGFGAAIAVVAAVRRKACIAKMYKETNHPDNRRSAISCYTNFLKYAKLLGIDDDENLTDRQLAVKVNETLKEKMPDMCRLFAELSETALLAYMSEEEVSDEESTHARMALADIQSRTFEVLTLPQRLVATWILGMY